MTNIGLSKSRVILGMQCPKWLYLLLNKPDLAEVVDNEAQLATGHLVGEVAQSLFPGGTLIDYSKVAAEMVEPTRAHLADSPEKPLYEGTFTHDGVLVRADIMLEEEGKVRLIEVKSATKTKPYYLTDCAIQTWVIEACGYPLDWIELALIDSSFLYKGDGDYSGLFKFEDVTDDVRALLPGVPGQIKDLRDRISGTCPAIDIGKHCKNPWPCPFHGYCTKDLPVYEYPVSILPNRDGKLLAERLVAEGFNDLRDVPADRITKPLFERIRRVSISGQPEIDHEQARALIDTKTYPKYYLDFETVQFAVPIWAYTRPYEKHPFQWSCHVETAPGKLEHREFLDTSGDAPMRRWTESLLEALGDSGPIFHYHHFERGRLKEAASRFPDLEPRINSVIERLVDLLPIAKKHYYDPRMMGSFSIKKVLPTVTQEVGYDSVGDVQEGGAASEAYLEMIDDDTPPARKVKLEKDLKAYCGLDTIAMKYVLDKLCGRPEHSIVSDMNLMK